MFKLYNDCPNDELQAYWDSENKATQNIKKMGYLITYFPLESGYYLCFTNTYKSTGPLFQSRISALNWLKTNKNI